MRTMKMTQAHYTQLYSGLLSNPLTREVQDLLSFFKGLSLNDSGVIELTVGALPETVGDKPVLKFVNCRCGGNTPFREGETEAKCTGCGVRIAVVK